MGKWPADQSHKFLVFGLSKGTVIFLPIDSIDMIYARFSFHRQAVTTLHQIHGTSNFVSICDEFNLCVWGFKDHKSIVYNSVQMFRPIASIVSLSKVVFVAFKSNDIQKFRFNEELEQLQFVKTEMHLEHDKAVTDLDCHIEK